MDNAPAKSFIILFLLYVSEVILITLMGCVLLNPKVSEVYFYLASFLILIPFLLCMAYNASFMYGIPIKFIKGKVKIEWRRTPLWVLSWGLPILPIVVSLAIIFSGALSGYVYLTKLFANILVLSYLLFTYAILIMVLSIFRGYVAQHKLKSIFFFGGLSIIGLILAILFIYAKGGYVIILSAEGIFIPFIPILFERLSKLSKVEFNNLYIRIGKLEGFLIISFAFLLLAFFTSSIPQLSNISILSLQKPLLFTDTYLLLLAVGLALLFYTLYLIVRSIYDIISHSIYNLQIKPLKEKMSRELGYFPFNSTETLLDPKTIREILNSPITWYSKKALEIRIGILDKYSGVSEAKITKINASIEEFIENFSTIAPLLLNGYCDFYEYLQKISENDIQLITGLFNAELNYDATNWPNIYNAIYKKQTPQTFNSLLEKIDTSEETKKFKELYSKYIDLKNSIEKIDEIFYG